MNHKVLLGSAMAGLLLAASAESQTVSQIIQSNSTSAIPTPKFTIHFDLVNRHIILPVKVNDSRPLSFVLDTGDKFAIIDMDRAKELGLNLQGAVRMQGAGPDSKPGAFVQDSSFTIPGMPGFSQPVTLALPIGTLAPRLGHDFDGIIGTDFMKQFVVELDYSAKVIKLYDKAGFTYSGPGESIPVRLNQAGHPIIEAEVTPIGGIPIKGDFVVDIGSGAALALYSPFVTERHLLNPTLKTIKMLGAGGAGGQITGQIGRVAALKIGRFNIGNPITLFSEDKEGAFASSALLGNIGEQIMSKFRILFDFNQDRIILEPNSTFSEPFERASSGLSVKAEGKDYRTFRITDILENSPASETGLQKNDIISAIDGKPAAEVSLTKLNEMFERPGPYKLTVRRGEQVLRVKLTARKLV